MRGLRALVVLGAALPATRVGAPSGPAALGISAFSTTLTWTPVVVRP